MSRRKNRSFINKRPKKNINKKHIEGDEIVLNKKIINATRVEFDGVKYNSKLEAFCAEELKNNEIKFGYETKKFTLMDKFVSNCPFYESVKYTDRQTKEKVKTFKVSNPNIRAMTYTPDFIGDGWIIETKGMMTDSAQLKQKLFKKYLRDNDIHYIVFVPRNKQQVVEAVEIIKEITTI